MIVKHVGDELVLRPQTQEELRFVRNLPSRKFDGKTESWRVMLVHENWDLLAAQGYLDGLSVARPNRSAYHVEVVRKKLAVYVPPTSENIFKCKSIPENKMWEPRLEAWICKPSLRNFDYLKSTFPDLTWSSDALGLYKLADDARVAAKVLRDKKEAIVAQDVEVHDYKFGTTPFQHQMKAFLLGRDEPAFMLSMEQGTGKSKTFIDNACYLFLKNKIDAVLLICPNSVKSNWPDEVLLHTSPDVEHEIIVWETGVPKDFETRRKNAKAQGKLFWVIMNIEAFSSKKGADFALAFCSKNETIVCVDESSKIKTVSATRTKNVMKLRPITKYRRTMSGTPITQGPLDAFSQYAFLDPKILGFSSYFSYKNHFAVTGGFQNREIIGYNNLEELQDLIDPYSFRVLKADCLDLPEKIYQRLTVDMNPEQKRLYKQIQNEMLATFAGHEIEVINILAQMLRLAQVTGGFIAVPGDPDAGIEPHVEPIPGTNPKLVALLDTLENIVGKAIIWCRFRPEIDLIQEALRNEYGHDSVVEFHGGVSTDDRTRARREFQDASSPVRFFVGQVQTGGIGLTLTQAKTVFYYSNSFSLEDRLQSEDRAHRIGQDQHVTYIDLVAKGTIDVKTLSALRSKKNLANLITGDNWTQWI